MGSHTASHTVCMCLRGLCRLPSHVLTGTALRNHRGGVRTRLLRRTGDLRLCVRCSTSTHPPWLPSSFSTGRSEHSPRLLNMAVPSGSSPSTSGGRRRKPRANHEGGPVEYRGGTASGEADREGPVEGKNWSTTLHVLWKAILSQSYSIVLMPLTSPRDSDRVGARHDGYSQAGSPPGTALPSLGMTKTPSDRRQPGLQGRGAQGIVEPPGGGP